MRKYLYFFGLLNDDDVDWLAGAGKVIECPSGFKLLQQGERIRHLCIILRGTFDVVEHGLLLGTLGPGDILGGPFLLDGKPAHVSAVARDEAAVLQVSFDRLRSQLGYDLPFAARFYRAIGTFLSQRLRAVSALLTTTTARVSYEEDDATDIDESEPAIAARVSAGTTRFRHLIDRLQKHH